MLVLLLVRLLVRLLVLLLVLMLVLLLRRARRTGADRERSAGALLSSVKKPSQFVNKTT